MGNSHGKTARQRSHGKTAQARLVEATKANDVKAVRTLLKRRDVDINDADEHGWTPLHQASSKGYLAVVEVLLTADADLRTTTKRGWTPLHQASSKGHLQIVELLLKAGGDLRTTDKRGWTPLHQASSKGHLQVVEVLLKADADLRTTDKDKRTPLHLVSYSGHSLVVEMLVKAGADLNAANKSAKTPLHMACKAHQSDVVRALLASGADLHASDINGHEPLHFCLFSELTFNTLETLQVLVSFGADWDTKCDEVIANSETHLEVIALRICMSLWAQERADRRDLSNIPLEVVQRGAESTQAYIAELKTSREIVLRRKICLVGPSCAGKTSLVKSIISEKPQLVHVDDRTIGIDQFPLRFSETHTGNEKTKIHEVTFWDFAGQDAYQVAHSLFFSPRALFLVCVDIQAFTIAYMQAVINANEDFQEEKLLDEFMEYSVLRWVRMIVARQPDAEFVFIATKEDALAENKGTETLLKSHLKAKLAEVAATVHKLEGKNADDEGPTAEGSISAELSVLGMNYQEPSVVFVSCTSQESTDAARTEIENLVIQSDYSFVMPDTYSKVLNEIVRIREAAKAKGTSTRITRAFAPMKSLPATLKIEPELCSIILQTLHDLGDVLWYEDLGVELFEDTVILDPMLLIDFIRQIFNHKNTTQTMRHADLRELEYWLALDNHKQILALKQVLQAFHLVYSDRQDRVMEWDSDLIVPALWQTKTPASWKFGGDILRINRTRTHDGEAVRVHWEYHFEFGLPFHLFDHLIVASVSTGAKFDAGPDWILYKKEEIAACRIMVGRAAKTLHRTIEVEAVVARTANAKQVGDLWWTFEQLFGALVKVLRENPGLQVSSFAWDDEGDKINMKRLVRSTLKPSAETWMPPTAAWNRLKQLMEKQV